MTFPTTGILDNFNRTDANPLDGSWDNRFRTDSDLKIVSNQLAASRAGYWCGGRYNAATYGADCEVYASIPVAGNITLGARMDADLSAPDGYYIQYDNSTHVLRIRRLANNVGTTLGADIGLTISDNDKLGMSVVGTTITAWRYTSGAWSELGSRTDSTYSAAGYLSIEIYETTIRIDDFGGGTVVTSAAVPVYMNQYRQRRK